MYVILLFYSQWNCSGSLIMQFFDVCSYRRVSLPPLIALTVRRKRCATFVCCCATLILCLIQSLCSDIWIVPTRPRQKQTDSAQETTSSPMSRILTDYLFVINIPVSFRVPVGRVLLQRKIKKSIYQC
jgi:hypothetical protein